MAARFVRCCFVLMGGVCAAGCADVAGDHVGLSYVDGYAAPGETVRVAAFTRRSVGGNVTHAQIERSPMHDSGLVLGQFDSNIGYSIVTDSSISSIIHELFVGEKNHPMVEFEIPIPADSQQRGKTSVDLRLNYALATWSGSGTFETSSPDEVLSVPVTVVAPGGEWMARLRDIAARCGLAIVLAAGCIVSVSWLTSRPRSGTSRILSLLSMTAAVAYVYAMLWYVTQPLAGIFGWPLSGYRLLLWIATMIVSLFIADMLRTRFRKKTTAAAPQTAAPVIEQTAA